MKKDKTIIELLNKLKQVMDFAIIEVVDYWEADLCAMGLQKGNKLFYISTYNFVYERIIRYDYLIESVDKSMENKNHNLTEGRGVSESELISELRKCFGV